ncbi:MAG: hypothetical protein LQ338_003916 [Usnochroma carphineum]|nr:MAG: hypothetical protein LQ338_003916 [Usnochroma carphineum]
MSKFAKYQSRLKQSQFSKTVQSGTWQEFLYNDADTTRKAFAKWWSRIYLTTGEGQMVPKAAKAEIHHLLNVKPPNPVDRSSLRLETLHVLQKWEAIPLVEGSAEWSMAMIRLAKDLVVEGVISEALKGGLGKQLSPLGLAEARCWLYKHADGRIGRYQPLQQPWHPKSLQWDASMNTLVAVAGVPDEKQAPNPDKSQQPSSDPESLRLSPLTFDQIIRGTYEPDSLQIAQDDKEEESRPTTDTENVSTQQLHSSSGRSQLLEGNETPSAQDAGQTEGISFTSPMHQPPIDHLNPSSMPSNDAIPSNISSPLLSVSEDEPNSDDENINLHDIPMEPQGHAGIEHASGPPSSPLPTGGVRITSAKDTTDRGCLDNGLTSEDSIDLDA